MTASTIPRAPFDAGDAARAEAYGRRWGLTIFDPFADPDPGADAILKSSLSGARLIMAESFSTVRADGRAFRGYPFIADKPTANAFAVEEAGLQLCGLDVGLAKAAFEISLFVFSRSTLFKDIGDPARETSPPLPEDSQLAFSISDQLRRRGTPDGPPVGLELLPRDGQRLFAAHVLTQLMLRFVWLHELFHSLNGHTGLIASRRPGAVLNEMPDLDAIGAVEIETDNDVCEEGAGIDALRHLMEYDADRSALWALVRMQQADREPIADLAAWPKLLRLRLVIFAAATMTCLFDQAARRSAKSGSLTHPLAHNRLLDLVRTIASNLAEPAGEIKAAFAATLGEMTALQAELPAFISPSRLLADLRSADKQRELDAVDDALGEARGRFAPFAFRAGAPL